MSVVPVVSGRSAQPTGLGRTRRPSYGGGRRDEADQRGQTIRSGWHRNRDRQRRLLGKNSSMAFFQRGETRMIRMSLPSTIQSVSRGREETAIQQFGGFNEVAFTARQAFLQIGLDIKHSPGISSRSVRVALQRTKQVERRDDSPLPRPVPRSLQSLRLFVRTPLFGQHTILQCDRFDGATRRTRRRPPAIRQSGPTTSLRTPVRPTGSVAADFRPAVAVRRDGRDRATGSTSEPRRDPALWRPDRGRLDSDRDRTDS